MKGDDLAEHQIIVERFAADDLFKVTISVTLHSIAAWLSATRGAPTSRHGAIVRPAWANSLCPRGSGAELWLI